MTNVTQIESYRPDEPKVPAIYRTIDQARAELEGPVADVMPIREQAPEELTEDDVLSLWNQAVNQSSELIESSERPMEIAMLISNLVDDLLLCEIEPSYILTAVQRGFEYNEERLAEMTAQN
jgi:hypothetical protein